MQRVLVPLFLVLFLVFAVLGVSASGQPEEPLQAEEMPESEAATGMEEAATIVDIAMSDDRFDTLVTALDAAGLVETLQGDGPFTVFAPTDDAFAALPDGALDSLLADTDALAQVLTYHVVQGSLMAAEVSGRSHAETIQGQPVVISAASAVSINNARVIQADIEASNGVIHVVDNVLLPPNSDIIDVAGAAGSFSTLVAAIEAAGLVDTLRGEGPFTVFAPTDEAFAKLPEGTVEGLLQDTSTLTEILTYHVVPGRVFSGDVVGLSEAGTVQGGTIAISTDGGGVRLNDAASVVATDVLATNGVIHVIDSVIMPN